MRMTTKVLASALLLLAALTVGNVTIGSALAEPPDPCFMHPFPDELCQ